MADASTPAAALREAAFAALATAATYPTNSPAHLAHLTRAGVLASLVETAPSGDVVDHYQLGVATPIATSPAPTPRTRAPRKTSKPATPSQEETPTA